MNALTEHLKHYFGFDTFKGNQEAIIKNVLAGRDTFVLMPTGGGKSLCYQLPALIMEGTAIIISPLIALMKNQVDAMRGFVVDESVAHFLNSSLNKAAITRVKEDILTGRTKLLYVAPESLTKEENIVFFKQLNISFYAIDEAHCISEWGHDFRPEYRRIKPIVAEIGDAPLIALTATATPKVQHDIQKNLGMLEADVYKASFNRPNLYYEIRPKIQAEKEIIRYIKQHEGRSGIIYCLSRKKVDELSGLLTVNGIKALPYHAGMDSALRSQNQDKFLMEEVDVIVATIAFGMGIDKPDVRFVIHYDIPKSLEGYYQETGRAGRDHGIGECITFYSYKDIQKLEKFMQNKLLAEQEIGRHLLLETVGYAESAVCRRKLLLHYFGEEYTQDNCGNCDNCLNPKTQFEGKEFVLMLLDVISVVKEKFKTDHIIHILTGQKSVNVKTYLHHKLEEFGCGRDKDERFWQAVVRQALVYGLLDKDIENYGLLMITEKGRQYMKKPESMLLTQPLEYKEEEEETGFQPGSQRSGGADNELFTMLKDLRKRMSKRMNLPPFVLFQDPSLEDMTIQYPINLEELQNCQGVGMGKAKKYGKEFVDLIKAYVEEKEIIRPMDLVVKSVVNKSRDKVFIIHSIDRKMDFEDIAQAKDMDMDKLLTEIESIVNSGTKINIDYYTNTHVDEDKQEEIMDFFMNDSESGSVEEALRELGEDDYTEDEIRLIRIKFLSIHGN